MRRLVAATLFCLLLAGPAGAVDVSQLSDVENDPCVLALTARNTADHVDAPDSALADACDGAHGNISVAWEHLTRTWRPPDLSGAGYAVPLGIGGTLLAALAVLLATFVLGTPPRAVAMLRRGRSSRWTIEAVGSVVARVIIGLVLLAVLTPPGAAVVAAVLVIVAVLMRVRPRPVWPASPPARPWAEIVAGIVNDAIAAIPGLLAVALGARGLVWLLLVGALLPAAMAFSPLLRVRRPGTGIGIGVGVAAAVLAGVVGWLGLRDPLLAAGTVVSVIVPLLLVALVALVVWRAGIGRGSERVPQVAGAQPDPAGVPGGEFLRDPGEADGV